MIALTAALLCLAQEPPPNFVIFFADDLGYGDLGCFGHPTIRTPNLDLLAAEGQKWTQFYSADSVCTPSRAALMTGRLPIRNGMWSDKRRVLFPDSADGLADEEITIAELLKPRGYATMCIGKWHLGHRPRFLPTRQGFDRYFGIPYSNDMDPQVIDGKRRFNCPLIRDDVEIERPVDQTTLTRRYTEEAIAFVKANRDRPFFLYLPYAFPHVPLFASDTFRGTSARGLYGDVVEELDWSVGQIVGAVRELGLERRTLVFFSSDNGPWLREKQNGGSAGLLRGGKGGTFEGGMRVPTIFWGPGTVKPGVVAELGSTLDLLPTLCALAKAAPPADRPLDGFDLSPALRGTGPSPRPSMFFWRGSRLCAARVGAFKAHFNTQPEYGGGASVDHDPPLLYNLAIDPSEKFDVAAQHADVVSKIRAAVEAHRASVGTPPPNRVDAVLDK
jgi:arylsulfatase A-like enzyme